MQPRGLDVQIAQVRAAIKGDQSARATVHRLRDYWDWGPIERAVLQQDPDAKDALDALRNGRTPKPADLDESNGLGEWDAGEDHEIPPPRGWLLGNVFCRRFVSSLLADGGVGKTALRYAQLLSIATGRPLTGEHVFQRCRVLIVSLEDDAVELKRRILAVRRYYDIPLEELKGWLFPAAPGREVGKLMIDHDGTLRPDRLAGKIEHVVVQRKIDVVSLDPFVKAHGVNENDNNAVDQVIQILVDLAGTHDIAVDVPHHTSKGLAEPGNANRGRGASAMKDGGRLIYTLTPMSHEEAEAFGLSEKRRRRLIRMDPGKVNIVPPLDDATWFELVGVKLDNGTELYPNGDDVQTVVPWLPPDAWQGLTNAKCNAILTAIDAGLPDGERFSAAASAKERAAWRVVAEHAEHKTEHEARTVIRTWLKAGVLVEREYESPGQRRRRLGLSVDPEKRPRESAS